MRSGGRIYTQDVRVVLWNVKSSTTGSPCASIRRLVCSGYAFFSPSVMQAPEGADLPKICLEILIMIRQRIQIIQQCTHSTNSTVPSITSSVGRHTLQVVFAMWLLKSHTYLQRQAL